MRRNGVRPERAREHEHGRNRDERELVGLEHDFNLLSLWNFCDPTARLYGRIVTV
jgi:hypothetical protein